MGDRDWDGAVAAAMHALADGRGGITTRITALHVLGYVDMGRGGSDHFLREAAELGAEMRELQRVSPAWWGLAEAALRAGETAAAQWCEQGYEASARVRDAAYLFPYAVTGTRAYLAQHDTTGARDWLARVSELLLERGIPGTLGAIDHAQGLIHLHEGQTGKARICLDRAAEFWSARQRFWEGTAVLVDQARCATRSRRPADAALLQARALAAYASVGAHAPDLPAGSARAVGELAGVPLGPAVSGPPPLALAPHSPGPALPGGRLARSCPGWPVRARSTAGWSALRSRAGGRPPRRDRRHQPRDRRRADHRPQDRRGARRHILAKLGVARRAQIAAWVATHG